MKSKKMQRSAAYDYEEYDGQEEWEDAEEQEDEDEFEDEWIDEEEFDEEDGISAEEDPDGDAVPEKQGKRRGCLIAVLIVMLIFLSAAVILLGGAGLLVSRWLNRIERIDPAAVTRMDPDEIDEDSRKTPADPGSAVPDWVRAYLVNETDPVSKEWTAGTELPHRGYFNVMLVGQDRRPGEGRQRSDAMLLVSVDLRSGRISVISFLRDLFVTIPGYGRTRLGHAYWYGGFPLLYETMEKNFGVHIDGGVEVDFSGFTSIVDAFDGVDIELTQSESEIIFGDSSHSGLQHLNGAQALDYSRIRKIGSDFARTGRQRIVLTALFDKAKSSSAPELLRAANASLPYLTTDLSNLRILKAAAAAALHLPSLSLESDLVPREGDYYSAMVNDMSVLVPNRSAIRQHLLESAFSR